MKYKIGDVVLLDYPDYFNIGTPYTTGGHTDSDTYRFIEIPFVAMEKRIIGYYKPFSNYIKRL